MRGGDDDRWDATPDRFEEMVADIERVLGPEAVVKRDVALTDRIGGQRPGGVGTPPLLVATADSKRHRPERGPASPYNTRQRQRRPPTRALAAHG